MLMYVAISGLVACGGHSAAPSPPPVSVTTARITRGPITTYVSFDGQITPLYQTTLSTAEAGTIDSVLATEGDFVLKGQLLASLDTSQLRAQLAANQAAVREDAAQLTHSNVAAPVASQQYTSAIRTAQQTLQAANNAVRTAQAALANDQLTETADLALLKQEFVSRTTYEQARAAYVSAQETLRSALQTVPAAESALHTAINNGNQRREDQATIAENQAALEAAEANVQLLQAQIAQSSIIAPFDGQVTQRLLDPGAYAGASAGIFEISQLSSVYVIANVPDVDLAYAVRGKPMSFTTASLPGRTFHGTVFDVNTTPTSGTLSYRVRMLQPNPGLVLRGGMLVSVTTQTGHSAQALIVPSGAVTSGPKGPSVFIVVAGKAKMVPVRVGLQTDTQSEIRAAGLSTASVVITAQPNGLHDGSTVTVPAAAGAKPAASP